ncbi:MAG: hypothetical protein ACK517_01855, partial [bacterium]
MQRDSVRDQLNRDLRRVDQEKGEATRGQIRRESQRAENERRDSEANVLPPPATNKGSVSPPVQEPQLETINPDALQLNDVIASTFRAFPLIEIARLQAGIARGEIQSAWGAYDTKIEYYSLNQ